MVGGVGGVGGVGEFRWGVGAGRMRGVGGGSGKECGEWEGMEGSGREWGGAGEVGGMGAMRGSGGGGGGAGNG